jgi:transcription elongation factor SPT5
MLFEYKRKLVPLNEMPDVFAIQKTVAKLTRGTWVRPKRGVYKGDIGQVRYLF